MLVAAVAVHDAALGEEGVDARAAGFLDVQVLQELRLVPGPERRERQLAACYGDEQPEQPHHRL